MRVSIRDNPRVPVNNHVKYVYQMLLMSCFRLWLARNAGMFSSKISFVDFFTLIYSGVCRALFPYSSYTHRLIQDTGSCESLSLARCRICFPL